MSLGRIDDDKVDVTDGASDAAGALLGGVTSDVLCDESSASLVI